MPLDPQLTPVFSTQTADEHLIPLIYSQIAAASSDHVLLLI